MYGFNVARRWLAIAVTALFLGHALSTAALAQSSGTGGMALDGREHPGSPITGWTGNISPTDPYSDGPGKGAWITKAGMIHSRSEVAVAEVGGKMYVLGGYADGNVAQPLNEEYDPNRDMWRERANLPRGANHIAAVGLDGKLYAIGGFSQQNFNAIADVSVFDPATNSWTAAAPLPQPLGSMAAAAVDGVIHAIGGATGTTNDNRHTIAVHYIYDPKTNKWTESTPLPFPREHFNLIALGGKLYAIGGRIENFSQNMQTVYSLDLKEKGATWRALPLMPIARSGTQAAVLDNKIFVFGGERFGGVFNATEMFDPVTDRWSDLTPMPVGRHGTGAVTLHNMIFIPGGGPLNGGEAQTNANQVFVYP
jgi:N-acetylneuraminic acid mutarotase